MALDYAFAKVQKKKKKKIVLNENMIPATQHEFTLENCQCCQ